ncbi:MAG: N-acetylmuramoyl-L-alanine amidase [Nitrospirae bacterium]|nr:N-acetylmuramoyl-L-alanine amidase [Nitrospirota bacterium]
MTKSFVMKHAGMFIIFIFTLQSGAFAAEAGKVIMNFSEKNGMLRFVFQSTNDSIITAATVNDSYSIVKIDFPGNFSFDAATLPQPHKITHKGNSIYLNIKNLSKTKVSRYGGPPRLVIEAYTDGHTSTAEPPAVSARTNETAGLSILLDAGHGGSDTGIISGQFKESALSLSVCADLAKRMTGKVRRVAITRKDDSAVSISQRLIDIRKFKPNLFISIHVSSSETFAIYTSSFPTVMSGPDMAYNSSYAQSAYLEKSRALSRAIGSAITDKFKLQPVFREMPIPLLSSTAATATMVEIPNPAAFTYNDETIHSISDAIVRAVSEYAKK